MQVDGVIPKVLSGTPPVKDECVRSHVCGCPCYGCWSSLVHLPPPRGGGHSTGELDSGWAGAGYVCTVLLGYCFQLFVPHHLSCVLERFGDRM